MQIVAVTKQMTNVETIMGSIAAKIDSDSFASWIVPSQIEISDNTLVVKTQNQFFADYINSVLINVLNNVATEFGLNGVCVCVRGNNQKQNALTANDNQVQKFVASGSVPENDVAFTDFITSDENAFVVSACKRLAAGGASFSPLFIYGGAGCGKTLLAKCINSGVAGRTVMMSGGQFVADFARSLRDKTVFAFKDMCRNCDTFILDDVQTLSGKRATSEEFVQLIMDLRCAGKNIVLTSNVAPNCLSGFDRRTQSLFASGLVADVAIPGVNVRRVMLMRAGVQESVATQIAGRISGDGHLVGGVANKIKTYSELMGTCVDMEIAQRLLSDTLQKSKTPIAMVRSMCEKLCVSYDAVCGSGRTRSVVLARQIMMTVLKNTTGLSLSEIGCVCGGRDHASVLYAIKQIEIAKTSDLVLSSQINDLTSEYK